MATEIIILMLSREAGWEWEYLQSKKGEKEVRVKSKSLHHHEIQINIIRIIQITQTVNVLVAGEFTMAILNKVWLRDLELKVECIDHL